MHKRRGVKLLQAAQQRANALDETSRNKKRPTQNKRKRKKTTISNNTSNSPSNTPKSKRTRVSASKPADERFLKMIGGDENEKKEQSIERRLSFRSNGEYSNDDSLSEPGLTITSTSHFSHSSLNQPQQRPSLVGKCVFVGPPFLRL